MSSEQRYYPYESVAEATVEDADIQDIFLRIFPDATPSQLQTAGAFVKSYTHDGIEIGLELSDRDPIPPIEAYKFGREEGLAEGIDLGYQQALRELRRDGGIS